MWPLFIFPQEISVTPVDSDIIHEVTSQQSTTRKYYQNIQKYMVGKKMITWKQTLEITNVDYKLNQLKN